MALTDWAQRQRKAVTVGLTIGGIAVGTITAQQIVYTGANEGLRLSAYLDPAGIPTICYGHTGPEVHLGLTYTKDQCDAIFAADLHDRVDVPLSQCVRAPVPLTAAALVALRDFTLNVGPGAACSSTLVRLINAGKLRESCNQYPRWQYARGILLKGLAVRRATERELCLTNL